MRMYNFACIRCGTQVKCFSHDGDDAYCGDCNRAYYAEMESQPYPVQVGSAFGGPVAILVHAEVAQCGCQGRGWHITDFDSVHQCPVSDHVGPRPGV